MARFGQNPFGENIWRIVHAPSRLRLGHAPEGRPKWVRAYPEAKEHWVLEKWMSAYDFAKCTAEVWNMSMTILGPYPSRGEFELSKIFDSFPPSDEGLDELIASIEAGPKRYSMYENAISIRDEEHRRIAAERKRNRDKLLNKLPAFGAAAMSANGGGRGTKTNFDLPLTAREARLPTKAGHMLIRQGTKRYDVSHLIEGGVNASSN